MAGKGNPNLKGNPRTPGSGRAPGTKNLATQLLDNWKQKYQEQIDDGSFIDPMTLWTMLLNDPNAPQDLKMKAADSLAKFLHKAQPTLVEQTVTQTDRQFTIQIVDTDDKSED